MITETEEVVCRRLFALSYPTRYEIVKTLEKTGAQSYEQLCNLLGKPASHISHHLKILKEAGVVSTQKNGRFTYYSNELIGELSQLAHLTTKVQQYAPER